MLLRDLTKVYVFEATESNSYGEITIQWTRKLSTQNIFLNLQQDINELDRKATGEIDYSVIKGRTHVNYEIQKGDAISINNLTAPEYRILEKTSIGDSYLYIMEKIQW